MYHNRNNILLILLISSVYSFILESDLIKYNDKVYGKCLICSEGYFNLKKGQELKIEIEAVKDRLPKNVLEIIKKELSL